MTRIRHRNVAMRFKIETTSGTDASPAAADAFPFEVDGYSYNAPYRSEASQEANGSLAAGAPLVVGQPAEVTIRVRLKGAGAGTTYTSGVKPPHAALFEACGWRGLFNAAVAATALAAGTTTSATLASPFAATAEIYRGMPLQLAGGTSGGAIAHVSGYTAGRVATLADVFGSALTIATTAALPANWTYAPTSPVDAAARATDHPSGTLYIYEDGVLRKFVGCRGRMELAGEAARPGFATFTLMGIYAGRTDVARVVDTVAQHVAPVLAMGTGGVTPTVVVNRKQLAISQWSLTSNAQLESVDDPNTAYGFGTGEIAGRQHVLGLDPVETLVATRDTVAEIEAGSQYPGVLRFGSQAGNRWSLMAPLLQPQDMAPATRGIFRSEQLQLAALNPGQGPSTRDADTILCFY